MLNNVKIRTKIILMPALAGIAFLLILVINTILGSQNNRLLVEINDGFFPALELSRAMEQTLTDIQRNMQYAATAIDEDVLDETDGLRDKFLDYVTKGKGNPVLVQEDLTFLEIEFSSYYPLARQTTMQMINGNLGEEVIGNLDQMQQKYNRIQEKLISMTNLKKSDMAAAVANAQNNQESIVWAIVLITLLSIILQAFVAVIFTRSITRPLQKIVEASREMARGNVDLDVNLEQNDEIGELASTTGSLVNTFKDLTRAADAIGQGNYNVEVDIRSEKDILGKAISRMKNNLLKMTRENEAETWLKSGQAELSDRMRGDQSVVDLSQNVLTYIADYINAQIGAIYMAEENELTMTGSYAYTHRKNVSSKYQIGEGLVGQSALEKKTILISDVPDDYIRINSGTGEHAPKNIIVCPLRDDGKVRGVIELGTFKEIDDLKIQFLEKATENIAIAMQSAISRNRVNELLEETQNQAAELQAQQEELRVTNEELEEQTQNLRASEEELRKQQEELKKYNETLKERQVEIENKNTELETARIEIEKKADELEQSSRYKSEFLANMSHELRTPLNSIQILSKLMMENKEGNLNDKQIKFATTINSSGSDLLNLINEILDLSKIEAGKMVINAEEMSLKVLPVYLNQNFVHQTEVKGLYFKVELNNNLPPSVFTDRQRVEQILKNLISNAIKFTEQGGITVRIDRPAKDEDLTRSGLNRDQAIAVSVIDTGIGIPKEKTNLIFQAFQQADGTTSRKYGGTGLGLSISMELARLLGGEIKVSSEQGKGSIFRLILPERNESLRPGVEEDDTVQEKPVSQTLVSGTDMRPEVHRVNEIRDDRLDLSASDKTILVIEDDASFAKILFDFTRERGFKCLVAEDGEAGLQLTSQYKPSAVLLDIGLPRIDGWTVFERLKNDPSTRHIPIYFISGYDKRMEAMKGGAIGFLHKPVEPKALGNAFDKIESTLSKDIKKLLVVEDDEVMRQSIIQLIGNGDISILTAGKGKDAISLLKKEDVDCMILDLGLTDISGFELIEKIKKEERMKDLPIIIYTGKELTKNEEKHLRKHAESIIVKGVKSPERLLDEVSLFLHRVQSGASHDPMKIPEKNPGNGDTIFRNKKILVVDDDVRNVFSLSSILEEKEMQVLFAENGKEAIKQLKETDDIDLVLMDIMMPEMDGFEAMRRIREESGFRKLPIIALTAKAMKGDRQKCIEAGANDYLSKPIDVDKLYSLLQVWLYK